MSVLEKQLEQVDISNSEDFVPDEGAVAYTAHAIDLQPESYNPDAWVPALPGDGASSQMEIPTTSNLWRAFLSRRSLDEAQIKEFNDPTHVAPENSDKLAAILKDIHDANERIVILPDFDMDGISAGTLGFAGLSELGFLVSLYIPDPNEGYGFGPEQVDRIRAQYPDTAAIITCDNGITCFDGIEYGNELGLKMLVTDHHMPGKHATQAMVEVDPMRQSDSYSHPGICGATVLFQVLQTYANTYCTPYYIEQINRLVVFAGFGTVSDCMPMLYENRDIVRQSMDVLRLVWDNGSDDFIKSLPGTNTYVNAFRGIRTMLQAFVDQGYFDPNEVTEKFYGWTLAPTFNSVKRLGEDMHHAFGVFFDIANASEHMRRLIELNNLRKAMVNNEFARLKAQYEDGYQPFGRYIFVTELDPGVAGLLATRLMSLTDGPAFVLTKNEQTGAFHGSGRAPVWYPALDRLRNNGFYAAGHMQAFGVGADSDVTLEKLNEFLDSDVDEFAELKEQMPTGILDWAVGWHVDFAPDGHLDLYDTRKFMADVAMHAPYGPGFEAPVGAIVFDPNDASVEFSRMGSAKQHTKVTLTNGMQLIMWNVGDAIETIRQAPYVMAVGDIGFNTFAGWTSLQMVCDFVALESPQQLASLMVDEPESQPDLSVVNGQVNPQMGE